MVRKLVVAAVTLMFAATSAVAAPGGAKAIFDSGEGPAVGASIASPRPAAPSAPVAQAPRAEKYVGISYQLMLVKDNGSIQPVTKARTFRTGEKVKMLVRTNRPGYLTILNVGPTGNTNVLYNEYIDAFTFTEIPKGTNMRFAGDPGTEKLLIMLSDNPNPMGGPAAATTASAPMTPPPGSSSMTSSSVPPPPPAPAPSGSMVASNIDGYKSVKGSKDIVMDNMDSSYSVINPNEGYKPKRAGTKDIVLESSTGTNYGVVPVSAVAGGGILTLQVNLKHR
ncbi:MAG TPA: DUF4384 domain-containing protein [Dissulfurispiraceae bacterium]|nr:DUF4384 domain-containing protein [Dissulfurispiraceae bacterium]